MSVTIHTIGSLVQIHSCTCAIPEVAGNLHRLVWQRLCCNTFNYRCTLRDNLSDIECCSLYLKYVYVQGLRMVFKCSHFATK